MTLLSIHRFWKFSSNLKYTSNFEYILALSERCHSIPSWPCEHFQNQTRHCGRKWMHTPKRDFSWPGGARLGLPQYNIRRTALPSPTVSLFWKRWSSSVQLLNGLFLPSVGLTVQWLQICLAFLVHTYGPSKFRVHEKLKITCSSERFHHRNGSECNRNNSGVRRDRRGWHWVYFVLFANSGRQFQKFRLLAWNCATVLCTKQRMWTSDWGISFFLPKTNKRKAQVPLRTDSDDRSDPVLELRLRHCSDPIWEFCWCVLGSIELQTHPISFPTPTMISCSGMFFGYQLWSGRFRNNYNSNCFETNHQEVSEFRFWWLLSDCKLFWCILHLLNFKLTWFLLLLACLILALL